MNHRQEILSPLISDSGYHSLMQKKCCKIYRYLEMVLLSMFGLSDALPSCKHLFPSLFFRLKHNFHAYILAKIGDQFSHHMRNRLDNLF